MVLSEKQLNNKIKDKKNIETHGSAYLYYKSILLKKDK